jgi:uncharacterized protein
MLPISMSVPSAAFPPGPFRLDVADLLSRPTARRPIAFEGTLDGLDGSAARVGGPIRVQVLLERIPDGIVVRGTVAAEWQATCSTCLGDVERTLEVTVDELFEDAPVEGETYPIEGHEIDVEQLVRDNLLLELPLAPRCEIPCAPDVVLDTETPPDPRWSALSELELSPPDS